MTNSANNIQDLATEPFEHWQKRILWQCKRGNLETELLLNRYISQLQSIDIAQQRLIEQLLAESEQDLFHWLIGEHASTSRHEPLNHLSTEPIKNPIKAKYSTLIADIKLGYK